MLTLIAVALGANNAGSNAIRAELCGIVEEAKNLVATAAGYRGAAAGGC